MRHIIGSQRNDVGRGAFELSRQEETVLIGHLQGSGARGVVKLVEGVFLYQIRRHALLLQEFLQRLAERLGRGEEHAAIIDGVALHIVEVAVGVCLEVVVQTVAAQRLQQGNVLGLHFGDKALIDARRVALVFDVEAEFGLLDIRGQIVDVFHHQCPVGLRGVVAGVLQRLDEQAAVGLRHVG